MVPVRWYAGTFTLEARVLRLPVAKGCPPLMVRLDRDVPYPAGQVRSVTLLFDGARLQADVTAEVPVACYPGGQAPDPERVAGIDLGIIHPYAVAGPDGRGLLVWGGRSARSAACTCATARPGPGCRRRAPDPGSGGHGGGGSTAVSQRAAEGRHARRVRQAQHEAARSVVDWAVKQRAGTLIAGILRRPAAGRRAGARQAAAGLADRAPDVGAAGQGRGRRDHRQGDR